MMKYLLLLVGFIGSSSCVDEQTINAENTKIYQGFESYKQDSDLHYLGSYFDGIECAKRSNRPILLYFTPHGMCYDEFWEDFMPSRAFRKIANDNYVLVLLYVDDRRKMSEDDFKNIHQLNLDTTFIKNIEERRTIGTLNTSIQFQKFESILY